MDSKIRLDSAYTASDWSLAAELVQKRAPDERPDTGPTLIITLPLSLALWAGIWGVVGSLAVTLLRAPTVSRLADDSVGFTRHRGVLHRR